MSAGLPQSVDGSRQMTELLLQSGTRVPLIVEWEFPLIVDSRIGVCLHGALTRLPVIGFPEPRERGPEVKDWLLSRQTISPDDETGFSLNDETRFPLPGDWRTDLTMPCSSGFSTTPWPVITQEMACNTKADLGAIAQECLVRGAVGASARSAGGHRYDLPSKSGHLKPAKNTARILSRVPVSDRSAVKKTGAADGRTATERDARRTIPDMCAAISDNARYANLTYSAASTRIRHPGNAAKALEGCSTALPPAGETWSAGGSKR
jgi:hypothetical protein